MMFAAVSVATFLTSCSKDDAANPASKVCLVTSLSSEGDTLEESYEYNSSNKLITNQFYGDNNTKSSSYSYIYSGNTVERKYVNTSDSQNDQPSTIFTLGDNGYAKFSVTKSMGSGWESADSTFFTYDKAGYLIKKEIKQYYKGSSSDFTLSHSSTTNYSISNGNTVKEIRTSGSTTSTSTTEFHDNTNSTNLFNPLSLTGKSDKNLPKKTTGSKYSYSYSYEFDNNNNPVKATIVEEYDGKTDTEIVLFNYSCK